MPGLRWWFLRRYERRYRVQRSSAVTDDREGLRMREVNFESISSRNGGQDEAFEELCCQLGRREPGVPEGGEFHRYRGAGGDGGVECIWSLPGMREWGWQAKYIFDFDRTLRDLDESFRTAITTHPRLVRYIMCVPFDLTGTTVASERHGVQKT